MVCLHMQLSRWSSSEASATCLRMTDHLHQQSKRERERTSRLKNEVQQAISHSKMEAKLQNKEIIQKTSESRADAMRSFKKRRTDSKVEAKIERDLARM
jgi:hypothetical protein